MMPNEPVAPADPASEVIDDTSGLTYRGIWAYAKTIATVLGSLLLVLVELITDEQWKRYVQGAIILLTWVATYQVPNQLAPTRITVLGRHAAP